MRKVPEIAVEFLKEAESCRLVAYRDSASVWTVGVGHTGPEVHPGLTITQAQADAYLFTDATKAATRLALAVKPEIIDRLSDHQYAALVSFVFNLGCDPKWTIWKVLNAGQINDAPAQMMRFDKARVNGALVTIAGLHNRRAAEVALWNTADVAGAAAVANAIPVSEPSSYTRAVETPQAPNAGKPLAKSKTFITGCVSACVTAGSQVIEPAKHAVSQVSDAIAPYAGSSSVIQATVSHLGMIAAALAVATVVFAYLKNREAKEL